MAAWHDAFKVATTQDVTFNTSGGSSAQSSALGSQTYYVRLVFKSATVGDAVRVAIGANPTATSTSILMPANWVDTWKVNPGQKLAVLSDQNTTGKLNITELTD